MNVCSPPAGSSGGVHRQLLHVPRGTGQDCAAVRRPERRAAGSTAGGAGCGGWSGFRDLFDFNWMFPMLLKEKDLIL